MSQIKEPTEEQVKIINNTGNIVVTARPGSGKTFTVVEKIKRISEQLYDYQGVIAISFTRKASHELEVRCKNSGAPRRQSFYGTIDNFYISQIIMPFAKHLTNKVIQLEVVTSAKDIPYYEPLLQLSVNSTEKIEEMLIESLSRGYVFLDLCGETAFYILSHVQPAKEYLLAKYTHIFIDEYQDCGEIQHKIFMSLVEMGIIGVAVGDVNQAIYAFSNRYPKFLISLITNHLFAHYEITRNHRCHQSISDYSLRLFGIIAKTPCNETRIFKVRVKGDEERIATAITACIPAIKEKYQVNDNNKIGILCRGNASAQIVFNSLGLPSKLFVETELDKFNAYWARMFNDFLQCYYDSDIYDVDFVEKYVHEESNHRIYSKVLNLVSELFDLPDVDLITHISDIVKLAKVIYPEYENAAVVQVLKQVLGSTDTLRSYKPASSEEINILTLHKSKGLEYDIVFHLDLYQWIMPPYKATEEDYEQSLNLHYVGVTRAKKVCYIMQGTIRHRADGVAKEAGESEFLNMDGLKELRAETCWDRYIDN